MSQPIGPSQPSIGRIVHFTPDGATRVPAIVVQVLSGTGQCMLTVFHSNATESGVIASHVEPSADIAVAKRTWCWPPVMR